MPFSTCGWEEAVSKYVCRVSNLQELTVMCLREDLVL